MTHLTQFRMFASLFFILSMVNQGLGSKIKTIECPCVTPDFSENIAHSIHSLTVQDLRLFDPSVTENNSVPTINRNLTKRDKVLSYAPNVTLSHDFKTAAFNLIDDTLTHADSGNDGLGKNWQPLERIVHRFHMRDLWRRILDKYNNLKRVPVETCHCLMDIKRNGIYDRLEWIANRYSVDTPISIHEWSTPIPKLNSIKEWPEWKMRFSYYYNDQADTDSAVFLFCALNKD